MTNTEKRELRNLCKSGLNFKNIRSLVGCSDATIKRYLKVFSPFQPTPTKQEGKE